MVGPRRVFLSHTSELREFPAGRSFVAAAEAAVARAGDVVLDTASFTARDTEAADHLVELVRGCDVYVGLIGLRYGSAVRGRPELSYTELAFDAATEAGLPRLVFVLDEDAVVPIPPGRLLDADGELRALQQAFRARLLLVSGLAMRKFASPEQLEVLLLQALFETGPHEGRPEATRGRVFISYRRDDSAPFAGRLYEHLTESFGEDQVFMDVDSIMPGANFATAIEQAVTSCEVLLALIGPRWLDATDREGRRRIDDPHDFVRLELETALRKQLYVIPVLVDGSQLPRPQELPIDIQDLASGQAFELSSKHFQRNAIGLISALSDILPSRAKRLQRPQTFPLQRRQTFLVPRKLVFVSYSHQDQYWLDRLLVHLRPLERQGRFELWNDRLIRAGDEWREEIRKAVQSCQAAVLLVSADFMASDFIYNDELTPLLEAARQEGVRIISLIVSSSSYEDSTLGKFQAVNELSEPLDTLSRGHAEVCLAKVYKAVRDALNP